MPKLHELDHTANEENLERLIAEQQYIVAEACDRIVGLIRLEYIWTSLPYIGLIWIQPEHRKRGLPDDSCSIYVSTYAFGDISSYSAHLKPTNPNRRPGTGTSALWIAAVLSGLTWMGAMKWCFV